MAVVAVIVIVRRHTVRSDGVQSKGMSEECELCAMMRNEKKVGKNKNTENSTFIMKGYVDSVSAQIEIC